jgi:sugar/nucleoside kinase (ribokinase family)
MAIVAIGSVAFDSIETPAGKRDRCLGGSATYFSLAASFFTQVRVVAVVGEDFTASDEHRLTRRGIDTRGLEHVPGKSFYWSGSYLENLNEAKTLTTELNVFESFSPKIPEAYLDSDFLFLGNIDPVLQFQVAAQLPSVRMVVGDTMNYWINAHRDNLLKVLPRLDTLAINDGEARLLAGESNLMQAAHKVLAMGPKSLIVKHGEYGATGYFSEHVFPGEPSHHKTLPFRAPAMPMAVVLDPTGAGDSFAGGFCGYLASQPDLTPAAFRTAMFYGGVMGSFAVEHFGTERLESLTREQIDERFQELKALSHLLD